MIDFWRVTDTIRLKYYMIVLPTDCLVLDKIPNRDEIVMITACQCVSVHICIIKRSFDLQGMSETKSYVRRGWVYFVDRHTVVHVQAPVI